jgi:hypothetical protein
VTAAGTTAAETVPEKAGRRQIIGLAVLALPTLLLALDTSVLYLALPSLTADLGAGVTQQLWIMDIYGFLIAGFLVTMGTLSMDLAKDFYRGLGARHNEGWESWRLDGDGLVALTGGT